MKINELLNKYKNIDKQDFEFEAILFLICEYYHISKSELILNYQKEINNEELSALEFMISKYINQNIPVQYITNSAYFYGNKYYVNPSVLIPRFDTEVVVEEAINEIKARNDKNINIVDIGTGSGCIAITLFKELDNVNVTAIDISVDALEVAKKNAQLLNANITFMKNDMLEGITSKYEVIISNPPYIDENENIMGLVKENEPHLALFSNDNGLYHYKKIIDQSLNCLKNDGIIIFEIPDNKCDKIKEYASRYYDKIKVIKDYNNQRRVMIIEAKK